MLRNWEYQFLRRNNLVIQTHTSVSQIKAAEMEPVRQELSRCVMMAHKNRIKYPMFLINIDKIKVYFDSPRTSTVHTKDKKTLSVNIQCFFL